MTINEKGRAPGKYATLKTHYADDSKPLPPYSAKLFKARLNGRVPAKTGFGQIAVQLGWWRTASAGLPRIVIPDGQGYRLDFLAGLDVLLIDEGDYHLETVIEQIKATKPRRWDVVHLTDEGFAWGDKSC